MGISESKVQIIHQNPWKAELRQKYRQTQIDQSKNIKKRIFQQKAKCKYPQLSIDENCQCKRAHENYKSFKICTKCLSNPHKILPPQQVDYQKEDIERTYTIKRGNLLNKVESKGGNVQKKQMIVSGPQVPGFYNGFSLPTQKYYKQKQIYDDFQVKEKEPKKLQDSLFRPENKILEQSITYHALQQKISGNIDLAGAEQMLKYRHIS